MAWIIYASVGRGGNNAPADVRVVQRLLNDYLGGQGASLLDVDGLCGPKTLGAISQFQTAVTGIVDERVDPNGPAIKKLAEFHLQNAIDGIDPQLFLYLPRRSDFSLSQPLPTLLHEYWHLLRDV